MNDKKYREQRARVEKLWDKWFTSIGMGWWQVDRTFEREHKEDSYDTIAETFCNWQYRTANITFYLPVCADVDDDKLEEAIVHEFAHVLLAPLQDFRDDQAREITEHTVTTVARSIIWARRAGEEA